jgi:uncharacterized protein (TIGR02172 family)
MSDVETTAKLRDEPRVKFPLVGEGLTADVYAYGPGRVLKLFHVGIAADRAEREFGIARAVHAAGLPAPAVYEVVEVAGRRGIVLERIEGVSLLRQTQARPWRLLAAIRQLAELQAQIHRRICPPELPSQRDWISSRIQQSQALSAAAKEAALRALNKLPDGEAVCHGDFHPQNIFLTARGPVVLDWETATRGDPLGDVACTSRLIQFASLPSKSPWYAHQLLRCTRPILHRFYLRQCLRQHAGTREQIAAWEVPLAAAATAHVSARS